MAGVITIKFQVIKNGVAELGGLKSPIYIPGPVEPQFGPGRMIYFEGFSVDQHGKQHYMDVTVAYRQTILRKSRHRRPPFPLALSLREGRTMKYWRPPPFSPPSRLLQG